MPYKSIKELPKSVKDNLPKHAQEIFKDAFDSAWKEYNKEEERAIKVAWSAVKKVYHKDDNGKWVKD